MATINQAIQKAMGLEDSPIKTIPNPRPQTSKPQSVSAPAKQLCPECGGAGWWSYSNLEPNHPFFGKLYPCATCNKGATAESTGLNPQERKVRFTDIETQGRQGAARMLEAARGFIEKQSGFLTIHGPYGNGKSTILKAIVNECIERGIAAKYVTMTEVMNYAREAFESQKQGDTDYGRITDLARYPVLVIDEVDKARVTDYAKEVQTHLFDARYRKAHEMGTVVAWNGSFESLELPWVRSRLSQFVVVENRDSDMRPALGMLGGG